MPDLGIIPEEVSGGSYRSGNGTAYMARLNMPSAGVLTSVHPWIEGISSTPSTRGDWRVAIYQGGSTSSIAGAELVWQSDLMTGVSPNSDFQSVSANGELLIGDRTTWLVLLLGEQLRGRSQSPSDGIGDWVSGLEYYSNVATAGWLSGGFPEEAPEETGTFQGTHAVLAYFTYAGSATSLSLEPGLLHVVGATANLGGVFVQLLVKDETGAPVANESGIEFEWYDDPDSTEGSPTDTGVIATNASGEASLVLPNSAKTDGQLGGLILRHPSNQLIRGYYAVEAEVP